MSAELFEDTLFEEESYAAAFATAPVQRELTAAAIQAVVALAAPGDRGTDDALESIVIRMAHRLAGAAAAIVSGAERSPSIAHAELRARVGERLESTGVPTSRKLASAASYSIDHFVRVFRSIEGLPPHAYFDARRIERATTLTIEGTHRVDRVC